MFKLTFIVFGLFCARFFSEALSIDELKQKYVETIIHCSDRLPVTAEDLELLKNQQMPDKEYMKCLFACVYKSTGMMNENGELWIEGVNEMSRKYFSDDPNTIKKSEEFTQACQHVNNVPVSDGNKGCERAALIFKCTVEKAPDFNLV